MALAIIGSFSLGQVNVAAAAAIPLINPMIAQLEAAIFGPFGLGAALADLNAQAMAIASLGVSVSITNPLDALLRALNALQQLLALLPPPPPAIAVTLAASAGFAVRLGGIRALIAAALAIKIPLVNFIGVLAGQLSAGGIFVLTVGNAGPDTLASAGAAISSAFSAGLVSGSNTIAPFEQVFGLIILTKFPSSWTAIQGTMLTV